jgi:hypothetical protein
MSNEILDALKGDSSEVETPEPKAPESNKEIDELKQTIIGNQNLINQMNGKLDAFASMMAAKKEEPKDEDLYDDDDELTPAQVLEISRKERKAESEKQKTANAQKVWDNKTDKDFGPVGFTDKSSKFYREVHAEYISNGNKNSPTGVYDSAARVYARGTMEGWIKPNALKTAMENHDITNSTLEGGLPRRTPKQAKEVTEAQDFYGAKLGFSKERIKKIYSGGTA